jgi:hypothetical protein
MRTHRHEIYDIGARQRGLITREDLRTLDVTRHQRATLVADGTLTLIGRQTYLLGGAATDALRPLLLAALDEVAAISHRSSLILHGVSSVGAPPLPDVLATRAKRSNASDVATVHSTTWLPKDDLTFVEGIPCTSVARSLFNLAGLVPHVELDVVRGAVDDAIRQGKASDPWLWWRLEKLRRRGRGGVANLEAILVKRAGGEVTESWLEREFLRILREAGEPLPVCQRRIRARGAFVARVDFSDDDLGIVIEVTGAAGHSSKEQRANDARRRNRLGMLGLLVLEFTYEQVVGSPAAVLAEVRAARMSRRPLRRSA